MSPIQALGAYIVLLLGHIFQKGHMSDFKILFLLILCLIYRLHSSTVNCTVAMQKEGPGFKSQTGVLMHGIRMFHQNQNNS